MMMRSDLHTDQREEPLTVCRLHLLSNTLSICCHGVLEDQSASLNLPSLSVSLSCRALHQLEVCAARLPVCPSIMKQMAGQKLWPTQWTHSKSTRSQLRNRLKITEKIKNSHCPLFFFTFIVFYCILFPTLHSLAFLKTILIVLALTIFIHAYLQRRICCLLFW